MNSKETHKYLRETGNFWIVEHDGVVWMTDQFVLVKVAGTPVAALMDWWNLPIEPGQYEVTKDRVTRREPERDLPKIEKLVTGDIPSEKMTPHLAYGNEPAYVLLDGHGWAAVVKLGETMALVSKAKLDVAEAMTKGEWYGSGALKPVVRVSEGAVQALVMPIRSWVLEEAVDQ